MTVNPTHLAQFNIGRMRAPIDDPIMEGFRSQLERINALADQSPGFVWRLQTAEGDATAVRAYPDPLTIVMRDCVLAETCAVTCVSFGSTTRLRR